MKAQQKQTWFFLHQCWHPVKGLLLLCLLLAAGNVYSDLTTPIAKSRLDQPVNLKPYLTPVHTPQWFSVPEEPEEHVRWYQLDLFLDPDLPADWLLSFRRVPHQQLTLYIPDEQGYQPQQPGPGNTLEQHGPRALPLELTPGTVHRLYVKALTPLPNQLAPELWPASLYTLAEYRHYAISASLQTVIAALLILTLLTTLLSRKWMHLLPALHFGSLGILLVLAQGNFFHSLPHVDPGHTLILLQALCLLSALLCYQQLGQFYQRRPGTCALLSSCQVLSLTLVTGFIWQSQPDLLLLQAGFGLILFSALIIAFCRYRDTRQQITRTGKWQWQALLAFAIVLYAGWRMDSAVQAEWLSAVLCLQAAALGVFYYSLKRNSSSPSAAVVTNLMTGDCRRRVFESSLRQHLQLVPAALDEEALTDQVLATLDAVLPQVPALLLGCTDNDWSISSHHPRTAREVKKRLDYYQDAFAELIATGPGSQINLLDQDHNNLWAFLVFSEARHHIILVIIPGQPEQEVISWQQAVDLGSYAHTLFSASHQTRFWQLQASLDSLTGLLNRNALINEAEKLLQKNHHTAAALLCLVCRY